MANLPRGIAPELLLSQVKNTMPYLFDGEIGQLEQFIPAMVLRKYSREGVNPKALTHFEYFQLCLCSHFLTCATPVPTDVDNQIRFKLWPAELSLEVAIEMAQFIIASWRWDFNLVSARYSYGAKGSSFENEVVGGHHGEWFTVACAAYCALKRYGDSLALKWAQQLFEAIASEIKREAEIFGSLWRAADGMGCLKTSANIAHNFGDLDRVMDMWDLDPGDPLRLEYYRLTSSPFDSNRKLRFLGRLWVAGELYKTIIHGSSIAFENHRHFALRKPKCLRRNPLFLVPNGPFFDDWGLRVAKGLRNSDGSTTEDTLETVEALFQGWKRLPKTIGYGRALRSFMKVHPHLQFEDLLQARSFRVVLDEEQEIFEEKWSKEALRQMEDIPSRA